MTNQDLEKRVADMEKALAGVRQEVAILAHRLRTDQGGDRWNDPAAVERVLQGILKALDAYVPNRS